MDSVIFNVSNAQLNPTSPVARRNPVQMNQVNHWTPRFSGVDTFENRFHKTAPIESPTMNKVISANAPVWKSSTFGSLFDGVFNSQPVQKLQNAFSNGWSPKF